MGIKNVDKLLVTWYYITIKLIQSFESEAIKIKTIRIEVRDFAMFLKHNLDGLIEQSNTEEMEQLGAVFNTAIQSISSGRYGYFWDDNER